MRLWLPTLLGLILVALGAAYVASPRRSPGSEPALPVEQTAAVVDSPREDFPAGNSQRRSLPSVPVEPSPAPATGEPPAAEELAVAPTIAASPEARERDRELERLRASGPDVGGLKGKVQSMQGDWQSLAAKAGVDVQVSPLECYQAGCFSTLVFKAHDGVEALTSEIFDSKAMTDWPGPKTRSAPLARPDGGAEVTWLLLPPDPATTVAQ